MKQMIIEEDIVLLQQRLSSSQSSPQASNLVHQIIDDIDQDVQNFTATVESTADNCSSSNEIDRLQTLKHDLIYQAIRTSRRKAEKLNSIIQVEQNRFSVKNRYMESTSEWQQMVLDAIQTRRQHMIERTNFIIQHKLPATA
jgi:hypothetical protein